MLNYLIFRFINCFIIAKHFFSSQQEEQNFPLKYGEIMLKEMLP